MSGRAVIGLTVLGVGLLWAFMELAYQAGRLVGTLDCGGR